MFPNQPGGMVFVDYDFQDQNQNWSGTSTAPASHNDDKEIKTDFTDFGMQYLFNASWGIQLEVPYDFRSFTTKIDSGKSSRIAGASSVMCGLKVFIPDFLPTSRPA